MLRRSPLRTRRTTPILKNFSSPPAVRPPMYHLSAPMTSRKPSDELSLPRRLFPADAAEDCGIGIALCCWRGECSGSWLTTPPDDRDCAEDCEAATAAAAAADEAMERGAEEGPEEL